MRYLDDWWQLSAGDQWVRLGNQPTDRKVLVHTVQQVSREVLSNSKRAFRAGFAATDQTVRFVDGDESAIAFSKTAFFGGLVCFGYFAGLSQLEFFDPLRWLGLVVLLWGLAWGIWKYVVPAWRSTRGEIWLDTKGVRLRRSGKLVEIPWSEVRLVDVYAESSSTGARRQMLVVGDRESIVYRSDYKGYSDVVGRVLFSAPDDTAFGGTG